MNTNYAGFWLRFVAALIDWLLIGVVQFVAIMPLLAIFGIGVAGNIENMESMDEAQAMSMVGSMMAMGFATQAVFVVIQTLYFALMESSSKQATIGKMVLGLQVSDTNGAKLDFVKALVRNLGKIVSGFILCIGYIMAGFTEKKQALHDMIASTLVVKK
jgi:uncharacterized RDD family membrane protein YckC